MRRLLIESRVPRDLVDETTASLHDVLVPALTMPSRVWFDRDPTASRDALLLAALARAVDDPTSHEGDARLAWGRLHTTTFVHPLGVTDAARRRFNVGPFPRGGYADTLMSTSGRGLDASVGASFSGVFDLADWDESIVQNAPGQSEVASRAHFSDLARLWSAGEPFPLAFSDEAVSAIAESVMTLVPKVHVPSTR